jgi:RNA polymerase sigma factor (sigma-70 family)
MAPGVPITPLMTHTLTHDYRDAIAPESFAEAYARGFRLTVRFLLSKGASIDTAEELAQTAWARGWEARSQLRLEERLLPWINSIAYRRFCNDRRIAMRHSEFLDTTAASASTPSAVLDAKTLLKLCSPTDGTILKHRYLEGMDMKEIAEELGLTEIAVRVRIHRCQSWLRSLLRRRPNRGRTKPAIYPHGTIPIGTRQSERCAA